MNTSRLSRKSPLSVYIGQGVLVLGGLYYLMMAIREFQAYSYLVVNLQLVIGDLISAVSLLGLAIYAFYQAGKAMLFGLLFLGFLLIIQITALNLVEIILHLLGLSLVFYARTNVDNNEGSIEHEDILDIDL